MGGENKWLGLAYVAPYIVGLLIFTAIPFGASFYLSFTDYPLLQAPLWVGLQNYIDLIFHDRTFHKALQVTLTYVFITVPLKLTFALLIAYVLNYKLRFIGFFRTAYYVPSILGGSVAIAVLWRYALQSIPTHVYEAAAIDGANKAQTFFFITLPLITPVIFFNLILQMVEAFQEFNGPFIITDGTGAPLRSTYLVPLYIYDKAFRQFEMGYASAIAWILFAIIMVLTVIAFWSSRHWVYYAGDKRS